MIALERVMPALVTEVKSCSDYVAADAYGKAYFAAEPYQPDLDFWIFCTKNEPPHEISNLVAERKAQLEHMNKKKPKRTVFSKARTRMALAAASTI